MLLKAWRHSMIFALILMGSLARATDSSFHFYLNQEVLKKSNLKQAAEVADQIYQTSGNQDTLVVGMGRSPTIFVEILREKHEMDVAYLPISRISRLSKAKIYNGLNQDEQNNLFDYFDQHIPKMAIGKKRLVFIDCSGSGASIQFMARELSEYVKRRGLNVEIIMGSIETPLFQIYLRTVTPHFRVISRDKIKTSYRLVDNIAPSNLMISIGFGQLDAFAPNCELDIRRLIKDGPPGVEEYSYPNNRLYLDLRREVVRYVRENPYLNHWMPKALIIHPQDTTWIKRMTQGCRKLLARIF